MKNWAAEHTFSTVEVDGLNLRCHSRPGDGRPLVLLNGLGQQIEILGPLMDEFSGRHLVTLDAAGVGKSDVPGSDIGIPGHAGLVLKALDQLGIDDFDLLGISWGGAVAQQIAYDAPARCRHLVLSITSPGGPSSWWGSPISVSEIAFPLRYSSRRYGEFIGRLMYGGEAILFPGLFREYSENSAVPPLSGYYGQVRAMCSWSSLPWLSQLTQRTLVIGGLFDSLIPVPNQIALARLIPRAKLRLYPAGHLLMYSLRQSVARDVADFLDG